MNKMNNMNNIKFPWASQFIANHKSYMGNNRVLDGVQRTILRDSDLRWELGCAFEWCSTKEGYEYWKNIAHSA